MTSMTVLLRLWVSLYKHHAGINSEEVFQCSYKARLLFSTIMHLYCSMSLHGATVCLQLIDWVRMQTASINKWCEMIILITNVFARVGRCCVSVVCGVWINRIGCVCVFMLMCSQAACEAWAALFSRLFLFLFYVSSETSNIHLFFSLRSDENSN